MKAKRGRPPGNYPPIGKCEWCGKDVYNKGVNKNGGSLLSSPELYKQLPHYTKFIICLECFKENFRHQLIIKRL